METGCSVLKGMTIEPAGRQTYDELSRFHYRGDRLGPWSAIYALKPSQRKRNCAGVIVYSMAPGRVELRDVALDGLFRNAGGGRAAQLQLVNENIRCISRVIIEPRYRGLGLASRLVAQTMPWQGVAMVEALAVMGEINSFFERAGMTAWRGKTPARCARMSEALGAVGLEGDALLDSAAAHESIERSGDTERAFIDSEMERFLQAYGKRRWMTRGPERTRFVLARLTLRPVYYLWRDEQRMKELVRKLGRRQI